MSAPCIPFFAARQVQVNAANGLNLRQLPSTSSGILEGLGNGVILNVVPPDVANVAGNPQWLQVVAPSGRVGFVSSTYTGPVTGGAPPTTTPPPSSDKMIGLHVLQDGLSAASNFQSSIGKPLPSITILNEPASANAWLNRAYIVVYRNTPTENLTIPTNDNDANAYAHAFAAQNAYWIKLLGTNVHVQPVNEIKYTPGHAGFWLGYMQAMDQLGHKAAICAYSVGTPEPSEWQALIPALEYATLHNHLVVLHAYCKDGTPPGQLSAPADQPFYELRFPRLYAAVPASAHPLLVLSEFGSGAHGLYSGPDNLVSLCKQYYGAIVPYLYCVGFNVWTVGKLGGWEQSDITSGLNALAAYVKS